MAGQPDRINSIPVGAGEFVTLNSDTCPICSAAMYGCDHEILRWSLYASEFEESPLDADAIALARAIAMLVRHCGAVRRRLPDFLPIGEIDLSEHAEQDDTIDDLEWNASTGVVPALTMIGKIPGVRVTDDASRSGQPATSYWAADARPVRMQILDWIRACEIDLAREDVSGGVDCAARVTRLKALAVDAFAEHLMKGCAISGPHRLGDPNAPQFNAYLAGVEAPTEHTVYFLAKSGEPNRLESTTVILIDERGPSVLRITSAGDEG